MPYIDEAYFAGYTTTEIDSSEFNVLAKRAGDVIDMLTMNRIGGDAGLSLLPAVTQEAVRKAVAAQVETLYMQGGLDAVAGGEAPTSTSIGKFSYTVGNSGQMVAGMPISPLVRAYLLPTGLLYRGLG